jgi:phosphotransferase system HPr (HPr) family protein
LGDVGVELLTPETIRLGMMAADRRDAIEQAGRLLIAAGAVDPAYVVAMHEREAVMSSYMGEGFAPTRPPPSRARSNTMPSQTVSLDNASGLHSRPARVFSKQAKAFDCDVKVRKTSGSGDPVNAKSTLSVPTLDCTVGDEIVTEGESAEEALTTLVDLVKDGLGEDH